MKYQKEIIKIQKLPSGDFLKIAAYHFLGPGAKKIYIQANVHGPELTGVLVAKKLIDYFSKHPGNFSQLTLVPGCNPTGLNAQLFGQQIGYLDPLTGKNWNRIYQDLSKDIAFNPNRKLSIDSFKKTLYHKLLKGFKEPNIDFESKLALTLQKLSFNADIVIDCHTSWGRAPHYVYCFPEQLQIARNFGVEIIILLDPTNFEGVFDEAQFYPYHKNRKRIKNFVTPKQVFTLELGNDLSLDSTNIDLGFREIMSYLSSQQVLIEKWPITKLFNFTVGRANNFIHLFSPKAGLLVWDKKPGEILAKGDKLGALFDIQKGTFSPVKSPTTGKLVIQFNSQAVHEGQKIAKILIESKIIQGGE